MAFGILVEPRLSRYRHVLENAYSNVRTLWCVVGIEAVLILVLAIGLMRTPSSLTIHIPPDLQSGAMVYPNEPSPANVYAFALYIFQQLYRWPNDGASDFSRAIYALSGYLTPAYREALISELESKAKRGELAGRERGMQELPGNGFSEARVSILQDGVWVVTVDMELFETVKGVSVKRKAIRYPLRVVRYDIDREMNPWGLALDGFESTGPTTLDLEERSH
ncbi:MAG: TIGR03746 family integrating conjugative element protein [Gammaproteobacteria bacterium]|nr:TIGR03746 family integrating conjugative element protein [Gammaproteobacteria bacterium]